VYRVLEAFSLNTTLIFTFNKTKNNNITCINKAPVLSCQSSDWRECS